MYRCWAIRIHRQHRSVHTLDGQRLNLTSAEYTALETLVCAEGVPVSRDRLSEAASDEFLAATEVADLLVRKGLPFREAHGVVGALVRHALERGKQLSELTPAELAQFSDRLDDEYYEVLANGSWLESKVSEGGTSSARVREQLQRARAVLQETRA